MEETPRKRVDPLDWARTALAVALFCFSLYSILVEEAPEAVLRTVFLGCSLFWTFALLAPRGPRAPALRALDWALALASLGVTAYVAFDSENIFARAGDITALDMAVAIAGIALVLEGTRRTAGAALPVLSIVFLLYPLWFGPYLTGLLRTGAFSVERVLTLQYLSLEGVIGSALQVTIEYVYLFVIFGAVLNRLGAIEFMDDLARALCGRLRGGSAKIATLSSLFMGLASGSAVANVVSQGVFTIPMMRREGYKREMAAAVEASASTGGQIMPPVMGAAAFLMAEYTRIPYAQIIVYALVPGLLFYFAIWYAVHWEALRTGMKGVPEDEIPSARGVLREGGLHILSLLVITVEMSLGFSMQIAVLHGIVAAIVAAFIHRKTRALVTVPNLIGAIREGFQDSLSLFTSAACAGVIIGVVTQTSFGLKISTLVIDASMGMLWLALILCGLVCLVLGMGLPTQIIYLTLAALVAPAIVKMGVTVAGAHLFIIYFGMMSMVTPPVCFAAFAAAGIAGAPFMKTGWIATKISIAGLLAPFYFAYHPGVMLMGPWEGIVEGVLRASVGIYAGGVALGMFHWRLEELTQGGLAATWTRRALGAAACLLLIAPGAQALVAGLACVAVSVAAGPLMGRKVAAAV
ncbi:MAG: transporter, fusion protein [Hyphomicrobiales bacterium]|nr:transporter, fusion protein [Hyphomicrobiales bacterium]